MLKKCDQIRTIKSCDLPDELVNQLIDNRRLNNNSFHNLYYYLPDENDKDDYDYELLKYIRDNFDVNDGEVITILISW